MGVAKLAEAATAMAMAYGMKGNPSELLAANASGNTMTAAALWVMVSVSSMVMA